MGSPVRFALGSSVIYTHRCAVARRKMGYDQKWSRWRLVEPRNMHESHRGDTIIVPVSMKPITFVDAFEFYERPERRQYPVSEDSWEKRNKTVLAWPEAGRGVIVALRKKQIGRSEAARYEDDVGFFIAYGQVTLYVLRTELTGSEFYVPEWAVEPDGAV